MPNLPSLDNSGEVAAPAVKAVVPSPAKLALSQTKVTPSAKPVSSQANTTPGPANTTPAPTVTSFIPLRKPVETIAATNPVPDTSVKPAQTSKKYQAVKLDKRDAIDAPIVKSTTTIVEKPSLTGNETVATKQRKKTKTELESAMLDEDLGDKDDSYEPQGSIFCAQFNLNLMRTIYLADEHRDSDSDYEADDHIVGKKKQSKTKKSPKAVPEKAIIRENILKSAAAPIKALESTSAEKHKASTVPSSEVQPKRKKLGSVSDDQAEDSSTSSILHTKPAAPQESASLHSNNPKPSSFVHKLTISSRYI